MMQYARIEDPPVPIMHGEVINPIRQISKKGPAKLDTGSAVTVIPEEWVDCLKLMPKGTLYVEDFEGNTYQRRTYRVHISLDSEKFQWVEITANKRNNILVGRNVLNNVKLILDGKNLAFEMIDP